MNRRKFSDAGVSLLALLLLLLAMGCTEGPSGSGGSQPLVFPWEGQLGNGSLGSTVSIVLDSNYIPGLDQFEAHDLHEDRIDIILADPNSGWADVNVPIRAVFSMQAPPNTWRHNINPGATITVVVFDLPNKATVSSGLTPPYDAQLNILVDGVPFGLINSADFRIVGHDGIPNPLLAATIPNTGISPTDKDNYLDPRPMLRLRAKRGFFPEVWPKIGGIEMTVGSRTVCMSNLTPFPASEASNATASSGPVFMRQGAYSYRKVVLVDPDGINLKYESGVFADTSLAGTGPFLDLVVTWNFTINPFCDLLEPSLILVSDLIVTDIDGNELLNEPNVVIDSAGAGADGNAHLRRYPVDLPPPLGGGGCQ